MRKPGYISAYEYYYKTDFTRYPEPPWCYYYWHRGTIRLPKSYRKKKNRNKWRQLAERKIRPRLYLKHWGSRIVYFREVTPRENETPERED